MGPTGEEHVERPLEPAKGVIFRFPSPTEIANPLVHVKGVSFSYGMEGEPTGGGKKKDKDMLCDVTLQIDWGMRAAIVGRNGVGKSTLLKLVTGELRPRDGAVVQRGKCRVGLFAQHHVEQLNLEQCPLDEMRELMGVEATEQQLRARLGAFGLSGDIVTQPNQLLSGGQKSRVALCKSCVDDPHLLILDEPTNHLDIEVRGRGRGRW